MPQKWCSDPTTAEQNKIWSWTNSCRISGSYIQIAHFPCFSPSLRAPPLGPRCRRHLHWKKEWGGGGGGVRGRQTNRGRDGVANMEELWHSWKGGREKETAVLRVIMRGKPKPSLALPSVWLSLDGNVLLHSVSDEPSLISHLWATPPRFTMDPPGFVRFYATLCIWLGWEGDSEERYRMGWGGGAGSPCEPPHPPTPSHFYSPLWVLAVWGCRCWIRRWGRGGKARLSLWNFIIFSYLDHDRSLSHSLPVLPFHLVMQTQASRTSPRLSVCPSAAVSFPSLCCLTLAYHAN